ncbi:MAG: U32 family peptidase [Sphaerochaetaceae bacterium]|nr:U32 family peptidase [Sphaerochaetaceae bacterium]
MELLSPAGTLEKLSYAYTYGADAAYIGMQDFSLRTRAGNITDADIAELTQIKGTKKLYAALNSYLHEDDLALLSDRLATIKAYPFDACIVSDLGAALLLRNYFGDTRALHLSTQANCLNSEAVKAYQEFGFSRIILGREASLVDIDRIKQAVPEMEIETFVHGAMCMAYSGRCFLSAFLTGRSANQGDCAHTCRWSYRLTQRADTPLVGGELALEEESRPGEYYPVFEGDGYTTILSSKDLCMIDHLAQLREAGVDSVKIEGRMKSLYYVATVSRAYRKALDALEGKASASDWKLYRDELFRVSHREFSTGFFFNTEQIANPTEVSYIRDYLLIGTIGEKMGPQLFALHLKNKIEIGKTIEYIGPAILSIEDDSFTLEDSDGNSVEVANHHQKILLRTDKPISKGFIIRQKLK